MPASILSYSLRPNKLPCFKLPSLLCEANETSEKGHLHSALLCKITKEIKVGERNTVYKQQQSVHVDNSVPISNLLRVEKSHEGIVCPFLLIRSYSCCAVRKNKYMRCNGYQSSSQNGYSQPAWRTSLAQDKCFKQSSRTNLFPKGLPDVSVPPFFLTNESI